MATASSHTLTRLAAPAGAIGALVVAVGVWLIPGSALDPAPPTPPTAKPMPRPKAPELVLPTPPEIDWNALTGALDALRTRAPEASPEQVIATEPDREAAPLPPGIFAAWQYEGYIQEGDRMFALVRIATEQRFLFPDQEFTHPTIPGNAPVRIKSIAPEQIVVEHNSREYTIPRAKPPQSNPLLPPTLQQAGGMD